MSEVRERLKTFISSKNMSIRKFEASINASFSYVNNMYKSIGIDKIQLISDLYPELNIEWLFTGKGEMLKEQNTLTAENIVEFIKNNNDELLEHEGFRLIIKKNVALLDLEKEKKMLDQEMKLLKEDLKKDLKEELKDVLTEFMNKKTDNV